MTNHCNFRCRHCFIDFSPKRDLPLEVYQTLARDVGRLFWLDIGGGEPFLRNDIVEIVRAFDADVVTIPTNGFFVERTIEATREIREHIAGELTVAISIDGLQSTHDRIRQAGSWNTLWTTFEELRTIPNVRVKINTVLCKENFCEIVELMELVYQRRPDFHSIILLRGNPIDPTYGLPSFEELHRIQEALFEILRRYDYGQKSLTSRMLRNYHRYLWNLSLATLKQRTQVIPCLAGQAHAVVMGNGDVSSCEMLPPVGNLKEASWQTIWKGHEMNRQRQSIKDKQCHCTHNCAMLDSILYRPSSYGPLLAGVELQT
ncbi:MAG: radical SAM protein [Pirellulales bacterium]